MTSLRIPDGMAAPDAPWSASPAVKCPTEYKKHRDLTRGDVIAIEGPFYGQIVDHVEIEPGPQWDRARVRFTDHSEQVFVANLSVRVARAVADADE